MIEIDITPIEAFLSLPADIMIQRLLVYFGWIPIAIVVLWGISQIWLDWRGTLWGGKIKKILLAIDIPRNNEQSPKAVENFFTYLAGAHGTHNLFETWWVGAYQLSFSFEIVSIDGYTQFLIRTPEIYRNLIETGIYSQYPDAEITEVNDYTDGIPTTYPDSEYDVWGAEFIQGQNDMYPIKTYQEFEHNFGRPEDQFKDPMASLMDLCSSLKDGEQLWYQILVKPEGFDWMKDGEKEIKKAIGEKVEAKRNIFDSMIDTILDGLWGLANLFSASEIESAKDDKEDAFKLMNLKPADKDKMEAISRKIAQLGFRAKIRFVYVSKKSVMNKPKVVNGFVGYIKQFMNLNLNNIKPDLKMTGTSVDYFFVKQRKAARQRRIVTNYKNRDTTAGRKMGIYTIDELATLWHFPIESVVKAPLIQKTTGRKVEPPMSLPTSAVGTQEEQLFDAEFSDMINGVDGIDAKTTTIKEKDTAKPSMESIFVDDESRQDKEKDEIFGSAKESEEQVEDDGAPPSNLPFA